MWPHLLINYYQKCTNQSDSVRTTLQGHLTESNRKCVTNVLMWQQAQSCLYHILVIITMCSCSFCIRLVFLTYRQQITRIMSDQVVTACHFLLSKRFCLKIVSLCEVSLSTNSLLLFVFHWICLTLIHCLILTVCAILLAWVGFVILLVLCSWNSVRM